MSAQPARNLGRIRVGTTSWTENTLLESGHFYPSEVRSPEERLQYYASVFPIVEVDSAFYALPSTRNASLWAERTDTGFVFDVKAFRLFTQHKTPLRSLPSDLRGKVGSHDDDVYYDKLPEAVRRELWQRFRAALEPLRSKNRLGVVLFQFAPWVLFNESGLDHVAHCAEQMSGFAIAVELRNITWLNEEHREQTSRFLRKHNVTQVVVDEPQGTSFSVPTVWTTTADVSVVRLHGRNRKNWQKRGLRTAAERFAYRYTDDELASFVDPVKKLAKQAREVHVLFNNCHSDWAQRNASRFTEMLGKRAVTMRGPEAARRTGTTD